MKKQVTQFCIMAVILFICAAGYFILKSSDKKESSAQQETTTGSYTAFSMDNYKDITYVSYSYNGEQIILEKKNGKWMNKADKKMELDSGIIEDEMLVQLAHVNATQIIENPDNTEQYGLTMGEDGKMEAYSNKIEVKCGDDKTHVVYIGNSNPYNSSSYYLMVQGDKNVYYVDSMLISAFSKTAADLEKEEETTREETAIAVEETTVVEN